MTANSLAKPAQISARTYYDGPSHINADEQIHARYFTYRTEAGLVAGDSLSVLFVIDRPAKEVWRYLRDFNLWQNEHQHFYSGVMGDLEGKSFRLSKKANEPGP